MLQLSHGEAIAFDRCRDKNPAALGTLGHSSSRRRTHAVVLYGVSDDLLLADFLKGGSGAASATRMRPCIPRYVDVGQHSGRIAHALTAEAHSLVNGN